MQGIKSDSLKILPNHFFGISNNVSHSQRKKLPFPKSKKIMNKQNTIFSSFFLGAGDVNHSSGSGSQRGSQSALLSVKKERHKWPKGKDFLFSTWAFVIGK